MGYVGVAPGTTTITLPDGNTIALSDWIDDKLFGTVQLVNGQTNQVIVFSNGRSQPIPGGTRIQTRVDTNIPRNGENGLPKDWEMLVYGWGFKMTRAMRPNNNGQVVLADGNGALSDPVAQRTFFDLDRVIAVEYRYNDKQYTQGVIQDYPQGGGLNLVTTNAAREQVTNGIPSPRDRVALVLPVHERENLTFQGVLQPEAALIIAQAASDGGNDLDNVDLKMYKWGLIKRTVI
jgi:hypothetical protein